MKTKRIVSLALVLMLVCSLGIIGASAANTTDTNWFFSWSAPGNNDTAIRDKMDATDVYFNVTSFTKVSHDFNFAATAMAVTNGGEIKSGYGKSVVVSGTGIYYLPNLIGESQYNRTCVRGTTGVYGSAGGKWSPDNSSGKKTYY